MSDPAQLLVESLSRVQQKAIEAKPGNCLSVPKWNVAKSELFQEISEACQLAIEFIETFNEENK